MKDYRKEWTLTWINGWQWQIIASSDVSDESWMAEISYQIQECPWALMPKLNSNKCNAEINFDSNNWYLTWTS